MRSTPTGGRPLPAFGYTASIRAHSSRHGTTRSISARNCARRVVFVYFSKPVPASVICLRAIITSRGRPLPVSSQHIGLKRERVIQRFLRSRTGSHSLCWSQQLGGLARRKSATCSGRVDGRLFHPGRLQLFNRFQSRTARASLAAGASRSLLMFHSIGSPLISAYAFASAPLAHHDSAVSSVGSTEMPS